MQIRAQTYQLAKWIIATPFKFQIDISLRKSMYLFECEPLRNYWEIYKKPLIFETLIGVTKSVNLLINIHFLSTSYNKKARPKVGQ